jgi:hypothetical protein
MAGAVSRMNMKLAARAAVEQFRALARIEDDYGDLNEEGPSFEPDEMERALARGDINTIAKAMPGIMQQAMTPPEGEQQ